MLSNLELRNFYSCLIDRYELHKGKNLENKVNFQNHREIPVHRWLKYREGYSVDLVKNIISELRIQGSVLDPFLGSGTTAFSAALNGLNGYGIEINPFPAFVANVKTRKYNKSFIKEFKKIENDLLIKNKSIKKPELKILDKAFNRDVLERLLQIKTNIDNIDDQKHRDLAFFIWLSILEEVSNTFKEGNGIKYKGKFGYKRPPRKGTASYGEYITKVAEFDENFGWESKDVNKTYKNRFAEVIEDLEQINYDEWKEPNIILGDAKKTFDLLNMTNNFNGIDLTVFSPPYANCFDYFEIFKIELWMGGFISSYDDFKEYRKKGLVSNLNANLNEINYINPSLEFLISKVNEDKLWDKRVLEMLRGYFRDMEESLKEFWKVTNKGGYVVIVVANSSYGDVIFPTDLLLSEISEKIGFEVVKIVEARKTNTSSQQMSRFGAMDFGMSLLRESLVYLKKNE